MAKEGLEPSRIATLDFESPRFAGVGVESSHRNEEIGRRAGGERSQRAVYRCRMPRPSIGAWYRKGGDVWCATVGGKVKSLGVKGRNNKMRAQQAYLELVKGQEDRPVKSAALSKLAKVYLDDARGRLKENTYRIYEYDVQRFVKKFGGRPADHITTLEVTGWLQALPVSSTTKGIALRSVSAMFGWLVKHDLLEKNPCLKVPKPKSRRRGATEVVSRATHDKLMDAASPEMKLVLRFLWDTGCRPGELTRVTAAGYHREMRTVRLGDHKTDYTGKDRLLFLGPDAAQMVEALIPVHPHGPLFRNKWGMPWTARRLVERLRHLRKKTGASTICYSYRHAFANRALAAGESDYVVSALMGHSSPVVLHQNYSHLTTNSKALAEAAKRLN